MPNDWIARKRRHLELVGYQPEQVSEHVTRYTPPRPLDDLLAEVEAMPPAEFDANLVRLTGPYDQAAYDRLFDALNQLPPPTRRQRLRFWLEDAFALFLRTG